jgi:hypothetical protein
MDNFYSDTETSGDTAWNVLGIAMTIREFLLCFYWDDTDIFLFIPFIRLVWTEGINLGSHQNLILFTN